ncbi:MAG: PQQ-binding-like beta-propeller repeat protein [Thermoplasmata archaeon]|nr:PQQ-binding-like beta-propeller repeat protein [Thermoplasmata archaeon]
MRSGCAPTGAGNLPSPGRLRRAWFAGGLVIGVVCLFVIPSLLLGPGSAPPVNGATNSRLVRDQVLLAPGADFTTYLGDIEHTSSASAEQLINQSTASALHVQWHYDAGNRQVQSQPIEQNGIVYFGGKTGYEYAVYATNGSLLWQTYLGQDENDSGCPGDFGVTSTATVVGTDLYVDGGWPYLYQLNALTGAIEWRAPIGGTAEQGYYDWASPLVYNGHIYVGIASFCDTPLIAAGLAEYSIASHSVVGYFNTSSPAANGSSIWGTPSVDPATNTIFLTTGNSFTYKQTVYGESIIALNATTLALRAKWQVPASEVVADGDFGTTPTLFTPAGGYPMVTAPNKNGVLYAFYQSNLTLAWQHTLCCQNGIEADRLSTSWGGGYVYAVGANVTIGGQLVNSTVSEFNPLNGALLWQRDFPYSSDYGYAAPLWVNGLLVVLDQGEFLVLNATSGSTLYQQAFNGTFVAAPSIARGEIFAGCGNDNVYAFSVELNSSARVSIPTSGTPQSETFAVAVSGGLPPYSYSWNFGDGGTSNLPNPSHTFGAAGTFEVSVNVTDLAGNVTSDHLVVVLNLPAPGIPIQDFAIAGLVVAVAVPTALVLLSRRKARPPSAAPLPP